MLSNIIINLNITRENFIKYDINNIINYLFLHMLFFKNNILYPYDNILQTFGIYSIPFGIYLTLVSYPINILLYFILMFGAYLNYTLLNNTQGSNFFVNTFITLFMFVFCYFTFYYSLIINYNLIFLLYNLFCKVNL